MQKLMYKTALVEARAPAWLTPNEAVELRPQADHTVAAYVRHPSTWRSLLGAAQSVRIGFSDEEAEALLRPAFQIGLTLRVRIVELDPAYLTKDRIGASVWGDNPLPKTGALKAMRPEPHRKALLHKSG